MTVNEAAPKRVRTTDFTWTVSQMHGSKDVIVRREVRYHGGGLREYSRDAEFVCRVSAREVPTLIGALVDYLARKALR